MKTLGEVGQKKCSCLRNGNQHAREESFFLDFFAGIDAEMSEVACALMYYCAFWILFG